MGREPVTNAYLLSPYFLDQDSPGLLGLAGAGWRRNSGRACMSVFNALVGV